MSGPGARPALGFSYSPGFRSILPEIARRVDFFEISPDLLCREVWTGGRATLRPHPGLMREADELIGDLPVVYHGLGLSIGTASGWNEAYLDMLEAFFAWRRPLWHSEHLSFMGVRQGGGEIVSFGVPLPLPLRPEGVALVRERVARVRERLDAPFLLENITWYLPDLPRDEGWDEVRFLNEVCVEGGPLLLLDLYNLFCNLDNFALDAEDCYGRLRLDRVGEVHLAGGARYHGLRVDVHSDRTPAEVLAWMRRLLPRMSGLRGVVYELMEQALPHMGVATIQRELDAIAEALEV